MTNRVELRKLAVSCLKTAQTLAGNNILAPRDWPTWSGSYPVIMVQATRERKESLGRNVPQFNVTATLDITVRVESASIDEVEDLLDVLGMQIERALINDYELTRRIQQFSSIETQIAVKGEGRVHTGDLNMTITLEFYQGAEDFAPLDADPLQNIHFHADTQNPFDPNGAYADAPFPNSIYAPPRAYGPDGRDEGALNINLPQ